MGCGGGAEGVRGRMRARVTSKAVAKLKKAKMAKISADVADPEITSTDPPPLPPPKDPPAQGPLKDHHVRIVDESRFDAGRVFLVKDHNPPKISGTLEPNYCPQIASDRFAAPNLFADEWQIIDIATLDNPVPIGWQALRMRDQGKVDLCQRFNADYLSSAEGSLHKGDKRLADQHIDMWSWLTFRDHDITASDETHYISSTDMHMDLMALKSACGPDHLAKQMAKWSARLAQTSMILAPMWGGIARSLDAIDRQDHEGKYCKDDHLGVQR